MLTVDACVWVSAFEPTDRFHDASTAFLRSASSRSLALHGPLYVALEVGCAIARRFDDAEAGVRASRLLRRHPQLQLHPVDSELLAVAQELGVRRRLRAADALYVATAHLAGAPLVTWDTELIERADAVTPEGV